MGTGSTQSLRYPRTAAAAAVVMGSARTVSTGEFDHPPFKFRQRHTFNTLPVHDANRFGGRSAYLREIGPFDHKRKGRAFKKDPATVQFNVDVWAAQQTLRKRWKGRDWEVVELPFALAPREMQRVIPEVYTDVPVMADPARGDFRNLRRRVYDRESLQEVLFNTAATGAAKPYPDLPPSPSPQAQAEARSRSGSLGSFL